MGSWFSGSEQPVLAFKGASNKQLGTNRCIKKIKNNAAVFLDFSLILLLYLIVDKVLKTYPLSLNYSVATSRRRACLHVSEP